MLLSPFVSPPTSRNPVYSNYIHSKEEPRVTFEGDLDEKRNTLRK